MALTVGTDSYITREEAETYLAENYLSSDTKYTAWLTLSDNDADVLLRKAARLIDNQPIQGYKLLTTQTMAFPRILWTDAVNGFAEYTVPDAVKHAQAEIAVTLALGNSEERADLQAQGVKSFTLGNLSETYAGKSGGVISQRAKEFLAPYIGGGFRI